MDITDRCLYLFPRSKDMMLIAVAQSDEEMAEVKEAINVRRGDSGLILHAFTQAEHDPQEDMEAVVARFKYNIMNSTLYSHLEPAIKVTWETLSDRKLIMLVEYTLWHSGPALAW
ncbi:MAG: hypothetical protein Q9163_006251, partial [Psora crenata]